MAERKSGATPNPEPISDARRVFNRFAAATGVTASLVLGTLGLIDDEPTDHNQAVYTGIELENGQQLALGVDGYDIKAYEVDPDAGQECSIDNDNCLDLSAIVEKTNELLSESGYPNRMDYTNSIQDNISEASGWAYDNHNKPEAGENPYASSITDKDQEFLSLHRLVDTIESFACQTSDISKQTAVDLSNMVTEDNDVCMQLKQIQVP